ncbi:hypothetical protein [Microcystis phage Mae-JY29]
MSVFRPSIGPTRPAPAHFPYDDHGTLDDVWAGRVSMASVPRVPERKRFCEQCQSRVTATQAAGCRGVFCKARES